MSTNMADSSRATAQLIQFIATEVQGCAKYISMAMAEYVATGNLPPSMFEDASPATKRQKRKDKGQKRKPSAFNMFVSEKMAEIRNGASDEDEVVAKGTNIFSRAVSEWKKLSDEEKKAYSEKCQADVGEEEAAADMNGDDDMEEHEGEEEEGGEEEEEPEGAPEEQAPAAKEEEPEEEEEKPQKQPAQPAVSPQPVLVAKKEKKRKNVDAEEPKSKKEKAAAASDEPKSEKKKKKKKDKNASKQKDRQES